MREVHALDARLEGLNCLELSSTMSSARNAVECLN